MRQAGSPLRVGAVLDAPRVPAWVAWILGEIEARPGLSLTHVSLGAERSSEQPGALLALYEALDRRAFPVSPDALESTDVSALVAGRSGDRARDLDVLLWLSAADPGRRLGTTARYGIWRYRHGVGRPELFWELHAGTAVSETVLEIVGGGVIYRSASATDPVSLNRTRVPVLWTSARFAVRRLDDLAAGRWRPAGERPEPARARPAPTGAQTMRHVGRVVARVVRRKLHSLTRQHQWFLGFRPRDGERLPADDPRPWRLVLPPPDRSYTDPCLLRRGGDTYAFFEVLPHATGIGHLAVARLEADGALGPVEPILPLPHHSSYPYVFEDGGRVFLIPESGDARRVALYTATDFPIGWAEVATLLDGVNAVDATVLAHAGRYWMWVTIAVPGGRLQDETFLYVSDRLDAGWAPHPRSPVISDVRRARPAGRPFVHDGRLIRPAQDCSARYGGRVVFNEVELLTPDEYRERPCGSLGPEWAARTNLAAHTYSADGGWEATDGLRTFPRPLLSAVARGTATKKR